jgi:hypothetical protein
MELNYYSKFAAGRLNVVLLAETISIIQDIALTCLATPEPRRSHIISSAACLRHPTTLISAPISQSFLHLYS